MSDESTAVNITINDTRSAAERYLRAGLAAIPIPAGEKNPNRRGWQQERWTIADIPRCWSNGQNIGLLTGEPSGWLVDVDLDCPEAVKIAGRFLDPTLTSGRESTPDCHWWYRAEGIDSKTFEDLGGETVLEIRANGRQTVVAPSLHPSGERYLWSESGLEAASVEAEALLRSCRDLVTAALVARVLPDGGRHRFGMALAGFLLRRGLEPETVGKIMHAAWDAAGYADEKAKREAYNDIETIVEGTNQRLQEGTEILGGGVLGDLVEGLPRKIARYWGWNGRNADQPPSAVTTEEPERFNLTDLGNAERLVLQHGQDLRYCHPWRKWLAWDGKRWAVDSAGEVERRAIKTVRSIYVEAANAADADEAKRISRHAQASESRSRIEAMIALARSMPGIPASPDDLDQDRWLLNVENGTVELRTGTLREHHREDLITKLAPVAYDPSAEAPRFARFLQEIFAGDEDLSAFVQRFAGYSLTGSTEERVFAILHGGGKNGKTTLVELLQDVMGDYAKNTDTETILRKRYQGVGNDVAALKGARFVSAAEVEQGRALAESKVKNLTGSDTVTARFLFAEPFDFRPEFKLWLSTNNKPVIHGTDDAIWDRIRLVPFTQRFTGEKADHALPRKLRSELPGVLAWMVAGYVQWHEHGLGQPEQVAKATEGYREEQDTLGAFFTDCCVIHERASVGATPLFNAYKAWCEESGEHPMTRTMLGRQLGERGFEKSKAQSITWHGIGLRDDSPDPGPPVDSSGPDSDGQEAPESANSASNRLNLDSSASNRLSSESTIGKPNNADCDRRLDSSRQFLHNPIANPPREGEVVEKPSQPSNRLSETTPSPDDTFASVAELFAAPPEWLPKQICVYRRDPSQHIEPLCAAVAAVVLEDSLRGAEVREEVERELAKLEAGGVTRVANIDEGEPYEVYVGRGKRGTGLRKSKWHNPFLMDSPGKKRDGAREEVLEKFRRYLQGPVENYEGKVFDGRHLMSHLHEIKGKVLGCHCVPEDCHAADLARLADGKESREEVTSGKEA